MKKEQKYASPEEEIQTGQQKGNNSASVVLHHTQNHHSALA